MSTRRLGMIGVCLIAAAIGPALASTTEPGAAQSAASGAVPKVGVIRWIGTGSQVYACKHEGERFGWVFQHPDATLADPGGKVEGMHGVGPSWMANDGSRILGTTVAMIPAPTPNAVPWLVLRVLAHAGSGTLEGVHYVLRTETEGGTMPSTGCDAAHEGNEARQPYRATYTFLQ